MSEIDLTKPLQYTPDGKRWLDVTWHRQLPGLALVIEYRGDLWTTMSLNSRLSCLRNKPAERVRPYTFEEAKTFVGKPIVDAVGDCALILSVFRIKDKSALIRTSDCDDSRGTDELLSQYTHPDGTIFGVIEYE